MKPSIIVSSSDLSGRLEGLLTLPAFPQPRSDLDGLRGELERADVREPQVHAGRRDHDEQPRAVVEHRAQNTELTLAYLGRQRRAHRVSIFSPAGRPLLGLSAGQSIDWKSADGKIRLKVLEVTWQPSQRPTAGELDQT